MSEKLLSTGQCAERKGVTRQAINAAIKRGDLLAVKIGPNYAITEAACDAYEPAMELEERSRRRWEGHEKPQPSGRGPGRPRKDQAPAAEGADKP